MSEDNQIITDRVLTIEKLNETHPHIKFFTPVQYYKNVEHVVHSMDDSFPDQICFCGMVANMIISSWKTQHDNPLCFEYAICEQCSRDLPKYLDEHVVINKDA